MLYIGGAPKGLRISRVSRETRRESSWIFAGATLAQIEDDSPVVSQPWGKPSIILPWGKPVINLPWGKPVIILPWAKHAPPLSLGVVLVLSITPPPRGGGEQPPGLDKARETESLRSSPRWGVALRKQRVVFRVPSIVKLGSQENKKCEVNSSRRPGKQC